MDEVMVMSTKRGPMTCSKYQKEADSNNFQFVADEMSRAAVIVT